ncbi:hypothetical protein C8Q72DRAFT_992119 [Fomitopsis betulina]|nr:hypothetical protein C8Q72DRAFT_992119 [Fomitopsis betulina]
MPRHAARYPFLPIPDRRLCYLFVRTLYCTLFIVGLVDETYIPYVACFDI